LSGGFVLSTEHNPVFDLLGANGNDIESLVAYALYKQHKRKWASEFEKQKGQKPDILDDNAFASAVSTEDQLNRYRQNAADLIISFANQVVDDEREQIQREAITTRIEAAASTISGSAAFGKQVLTGLVASLITTFVLIVLAVATALFGIDLLEGVSRLVEPE